MRLKESTRKLIFAGLIFVSSMFVANKASAQQEYDGKEYRENWKEMPQFNSEAPINSASILSNNRAFNLFSGSRLETGYSTNVNGSWNGNGIYNQLFRLGDKGVVGFSVNGGFDKLGNNPNNYTVDLTAGIGTTHREIGVVWKEHSDGDKSRWPLTSNEGFYAALNTSISNGKSVQTSLSFAYSHMNADGTRDEGTFTPVNGRYVKVVEPFSMYGNDGSWDGVQFPTTVGLVITSGDGKIIKSIGVGAEFGISPNVMRFPPNLGFSVYASKDVSVSGPYTVKVGLDAVPYRKCGYSFFGLDYGGFVKNLQFFWAGEYNAYPNAGQNNKYALTGGVQYNFGERSPNYANKDAFIRIAYQHMQNIKAPKTPVNKILVTGGVYLP